MVEVAVSIDTYRSSWQCILHDDIKFISLCLTSCSNNCLGIGCIDLCTRPVLSGLGRWNQKGKWGRAEGNNSKVLHTIKTSVHPFQNSTCITNVATRWQVDVNGNILLHTACALWDMNVMFIQWARTQLDDSLPSRMCSEFRDHIEVDHSREKASKLTLAIWGVWKAPRLIRWATICSIWGYFDSARTAICTKFHIQDQHNRASSAYQPCEKLTHSRATRTSSTRSRICIWTVGFCSTVVLTVCNRRHGKRCEHRKTEYQRKNLHVSTIFSLWDLRFDVTIEGNDSKSKGRAPFSQHFRPLAHSSHPSVNTYVDSASSFYTALSFAFGKVLKILISLLLCRKSSLRNNDVWRGILIANLRISSEWPQWTPKNLETLSSPMLQSSSKP